MARRWIFTLIIMALSFSACTGLPAQKTDAPLASETIAATDVMNAAVLASSLVGLPLLDEAGQIGQVKRLLLNPFDGSVEWLEGGLDGDGAGSVLLPWGAFTMVLPPVDLQQQTDLAVLLPGGREQAGNAPRLPVDAALANIGVLPPGLEDAARQFWAANMPDSVPVTGTDPDASTLLSLAGGALSGIDFEMRDPNGQVVGTVKDIVLDQEGRVLFVVFKPGSVLGIGDGLIPVSWSQIGWSEAEGAFLLRALPEQLAEAPRIDPQNLPDMTLSGWENDWSRYWDAMPTVEAAADPTQQAAPRSIRASLLLNRPVQSVDGQVLGTVVDWLVRSDGSAIYAVLKQGSRLTLLPWAMMRVLPEASALEWLDDPTVVDGAPALPAVEAFDQDTMAVAKVVQYWAETGGVLPADASPEAEVEPHLLRASTLLNGPLSGAEAQGLGTILDFILDANGAVTYLMVNTGAKFVPVPWMTFAFDAASGEVRYLDDPQRLVDAPGFPNLEAADTSALDWDAAIRTYWGFE